MNPKNALFISAALTTFVIAILAGVFTQYNASATIAATEEPVVTEEVAAAEVIQPTVAATPIPQPTPITPEAAAAIAAQVMNRNDLYSVETTVFNNAQAYLVTFSTGDLVTIGLDGQVLSIAAPTPVASAYTYVEPAVTSAANGGNDSNNNTNPLQDFIKLRRNTTGGGGGGGEDHHDDDDNDD